MAYEQSGPTQPPWYQPFNRMGLRKAKVEAGITQPAEERHDIRLKTAAERQEEEHQELIRRKLKEVLTGKFLKDFPSGNR